MLHRVVPPYHDSTIRSLQHGDPQWQTIGDTMTVVRRS
jgi:hypothetical protein